VRFWLDYQLRLLWREARLQPLVAALPANQKDLAKCRLIDPIKITRECKNETELFCKECACWRVAQRKDRGFVGLRA
jgi:hypothetical protein